MSLTTSQTKSYVLVGIQFFCIGAIVLTGPWVATHVGLLGLECFGVLLGMWALATMRLKNLHILPDVKADGALTTDGPYHWIRHPMYTAVLLVTLALVIDSFSYVRAFVWLLLLIDLIEKLSYEEQLLQIAYPEYQDYRSRTWRLIPRIF